MMIDYLKELVVPSNFCLAIAILGCLLWLIPRTRRIGTFAVATSAAMLLIFSSGKTAAWLLSPLEYAYPRIPDGPLQPGAIVVLAGYAADDRDMPLSSRPNGSTLFRVAEAVDLWRRCQDCTVAVTGFDPTVKVMGELLVALGIPASQLHLDNQANTTADSAVNMRALLNDKRIYLVTSAGHMTRSLGVFVKQGLNPIPAPTDFQLPKRVAQADWRPTPFHLNCSDTAVHEYVGIWWYRLRGRI
jgi:uncharacterized SAM-binding protein YcdF (DUF218 family)